MHKGVLSGQQNAPRNCVAPFRMLLARSYDQKKMASKYSNIFYIMFMNTGLPESSNCSNHCTILFIKYCVNKCVPNILYNIG